MSSLYPQTTQSEEVKSFLTIEDILRFFGKPPHLKVKHGENSMRCPLGKHDDFNPSFSFNTNTQLFCCHACDSKGDVYNLIAELAGYDIKTNFSDVFSIACSITGIDNKKDPERARKFEITYKDAMLSPEEIKNTASELYEKRKGVDIKTLGIEWSAVIEPDGTYDIIVPMRDSILAGKIVGAQRGKKKFIQGSTMGFFYEPSFLADVREIFIVEGLSDWLSMIASGYKNTIGLASATTNTDDFCKALKRFTTVNLSLDLDIHKDGADNNGSKAGAKKMQKMMEALMKQKTAAKMFFLGAEYKFDINDMFQLNGADTVRNFFTNETRTLYEMTEVTGDVTGSSGYMYARRMTKDYSFAVDTSINFYWACDRVTSIWHSHTKGEIESLILKYIETNASASHTSSIINDVIHYLTRVTTDNVITLRDVISKGGVADEFDGDVQKIEINLADGKYYPATGAFRKYTPQDYVLSTLNIKSVELDASHDGEFLFFIKSLFSGDMDCDTKVSFMQEWMGYCLLQYNPFQKMLYILGKGGNGKSTLLNCLSDIVGKNNFTNIEINKLTGDRFATSSLLGSYVNICTDMERRTQLDNDMLKKITGGDVIAAEEKFKQTFQFRPYTKIIMASNSSPNSPDSGDWLFRRLQIIEFNRSFIGKEDFFLEKKLRKERGLFFRWACEGLLRLIKRGRFEEPVSVKAKTADFMGSINYVAGFVNEYLPMIKRPGFPVETNVINLYKIFTDYMMMAEGRSRAYVPSKRRFIEEMKQEGYMTTKIDGVSHLMKVVDIEDDED